MARSRGLSVVMHALLHTGGDGVDLALGVGGSDPGVGGGLLGSGLDLLGGFGSVLLQLLVRLGRAVGVASGDPGQPDGDSEGGKAVDHEAGAGSP